MEKDKLLHFIACETIVIVLAIIGLACGLGNYAFLVAPVLTMGIGVGKELRDKKKTGLFDHMDIVFDFLGALFGLIFAYFLHIA